MWRSCSHHVFDSADELVVEEEVLGFILGVRSRVQHPTYTAGHRPKMLLPRVLQRKTNAPQNVHQDEDTRALYQLHRKACLVFIVLLCLLLGNVFVNHL